MGGGVVVVVDIVVVVDTLHASEVVDPFCCVVVPDGHGMQLSDPWYTE